MQAYFVMCAWRIFLNHLIEKYSTHISIVIASIVGISSYIIIEPSFRDGNSMSGMLGEIYKFLGPTNYSIFLSFLISWFTGVGINSLCKKKIEHQDIISNEPKNLKNSIKIYGFNIYLVFFILLIGLITLGILLKMTMFFIFAGIVFILSGNVKFLYLIFNLKKQTIKMLFIIVLIWFDILCIYWGYKFIQII